MASIENIPGELLNEILQYVEKSEDLSSLCRSSRAFRFTLSDRLFSLAFERSTRKDGMEHAISQVFRHAAKHDSDHLMNWMIVKGFIPSMKGVNYLQYAILQDAPNLISRLAKNGTYIEEDVFDYPSLKFLYMVVAHPGTQPASTLDSALRTACSYALPRVAEFLMIKGANPNSRSNFGFTALHVAVRWKAPWHRFEELALLNGYKDSESILWNTKVLQTVEVLLRFGAAPNMRCLTTRLRPCSAECWRLLDCVHRGQTTLHIAAASGNEQVVSILLRNKAQPQQRDREGCLPVFNAMAQGNEATAVLLLQRTHRKKSRKLMNPIVALPNKSTALHIACRFANVDVVSQLLDSGANVEATDSKGQTPLHEVLAQSAPDLEDKVVDTLNLLACKGASSDAADNKGISARSKARQHIFWRVREMFETRGGTNLLYESIHDDGAIDEDYETRPTWSEHHVDGLFTKYRPRRSALGGWTGLTDEVFLWPSSPSDPVAIWPGAPEENVGEAPVGVKNETFPSLSNMTTVVSGQNIAPKQQEMKKMNKGQTSSAVSREVAQSREDTTGETQSKKGRKYHKKKWTRLAI